MKSSNIPKSPLRGIHKIGESNIFRLNCLQNYIKKEIITPLLLFPKGVV